MRILVLAICLSVGQPTLVTVAKGADTESTRYTYDSDFDGTADPEGYLIRIERTDPNNAAQFVTLAEYTYLTDGLGDLLTPGFRTVTDAEEGRSKGVRPR